MKNVIKIFLTGSLVLSLSCGEKNRTKGKSEIRDKQINEKENHTGDNDEIRDKQVMDKNIVKKGETKLVDIDSTVENKDWQSDYSKLPMKTKIKGIYLKLFTISYKAFLKDTDIIPEHKKIENYTIKISEEKKYFHVKFNPKLDPDFRIAGGETPYGREVRYIIEKQTFKIKTHHFFK